MRDLKANLLLKHNITALLRARGQDNKDLAMWCRRSESWMSQIFTKEERGIPLKYLDRIADFFGIATYQLLQPGISPLTERRSKRDRRSGHDRRVSAVVLSQKPGDVDLMDVVRAISRPGREKAIAILADILNDELRGSHTTGPTRGGSGHNGGTHGPTAVPKPKPHGKGAPPTDDERT